MEPEQTTVTMPSCSSLSGLAGMESSSSDRQIATKRRDAADFEVRSPATIMIDGTKALSKVICPRCPYAGATLSVHMPRKCDRASGQSTACPGPRRCGRVGAGLCSKTRTAVGQSRPRAPIRQPPVASSLETSDEIRPACHSSFGANSPAPS